MATMADVYRALNAMHDEGIVQTAQQLDYDGVAVPVIKPEYLILLYLQAGSAKRRGRAGDLLQAGVDENLVSQLAARFELTPQWEKMTENGA